jgi:hypothetical protein
MWDIKPFGKTGAEICQKRTFLLLQIVWNPDKKKWTNVDGDDDEGSSDLPPPPKASELSTMTKSVSASGGEGPTARSSGSNVFKLNGPGKGKKYFYSSAVQGAEQ